MRFGIYKFGCSILFQAISGALNSGLNNYATYQICTLDSDYYPKTEITQFTF